MLPTLNPGQVIVAFKRRQYREGQVVIIRHDGLEKVKRIHAMQGGSIDVRGDNPSSSTDSRSFGFVSQDNVLGVVVWPRV